RQINVRVEIGVVRIGVMLVVLLDPPAIADAEQQVAEQYANQGVLPAVGKHLPMPRIMDEEGQLHADHAEEEREEDGEAGLMEAPQEAEAEGEESSGDEELPEIVAGLPLQQASGLDALFQITIVVRHVYGLLAR